MTLALLAPPPRAYGGAHDGAQSIAAPARPASRTGAHASDRRRTLAVLTCLALLSTLMGQSAQAVTPTGWKDMLYSYRAEQPMPLETILTRFAETMGLELRLADPALGARPLTLKGKGGSPIQFLDQIAQAQSLDWFIHQGQLHLSAQSSATQTRLELGDMTPGSARAALVGLGLFEAKFGWGELDTQPPAVVLSGPPAYIALVRQALLPMMPKPVEEAPQLMVFRLRHTTAADRQLLVGSQVGATPGLASTLRNVMQAGTAAKADSLLEQDRRSAEEFINSLASGLNRAGLPGSALTAAQLPFAAPDSTDALRTASRAGARPDRADRDGRDKPPASPRIGAYEPLNAILVWDKPSRRAEYQTLIDQLDVPSRQVEINVTILDVNVDALREWAPDLSVGIGKARIQINPSPEGTTGGLTPGAAAAAGAGSMVLWATDRLQLRLRALESRGQAQVLSRPSVLTMENSAAVLDMSQSVYVKLIGERTTDLRTVSAGTVLRVTPSIVGAAGASRDGGIRVTLDIQDGTLKPGDNAASPQVGAATVSTQALVREGESLVVGGYRRQQSQTRHSRVPGLDSVPLLGWLFRSDSTVTDERERLFIVTARVVH